MALIELIDETMLPVVEAQFVVVAINADAAIEIIVNMLIGYFFNHLIQ